MKRLEFFTLKNLLQRKKFFATVIFGCGLFTPVLAKVADRVLNFFFNAPVNDNSFGYGFLAVIVFYTAAFALIKIPAYLELRKEATGSIAFMLGMLISFVAFQ